MKKESLSCARTFIPATFTLSIRECVWDMILQNSFDFYASLFIIIDKRKTYPGDFEDCVQQSFSSKGLRARHTYIYPFCLDMGLYRFAAIIHSRKK